MRQYNRYRSGLGYRKERMGLCKKLAFAEKHKKYYCQKLFSNFYNRVMAGIDSYGRSDNGVIYRSIKSKYEVFVISDEQYNDNIPLATSVFGKVRDKVIAMVYIDVRGYVLLGYTKEDLISLYYHEVGHADLFARMPVEEYNKLPYLEVEIEADKYAAEKNSKETIINLIKKGMETFEFYNDGKEQMQKRLEALESKED